tara:strand:+ start:160 stop:645 length:486 start_codon:yes stop_codon:yes gene_type:complete
MFQAMWQDVFGDKKKSTVDILKDIPIFESLSTSKLDKIAQFFHVRTYKAGEIIFQEQEPGESMYIIKSGEVTIKKLINKKQTTITQLKEGMFFGEVALVDEENRSASAFATKPTELLGFFRADLMKLIDRDPRLASFILFQLAKVIGKRLRVQSDSMELHG